MTDFAEEATTAMRDKVYLTLPRDVGVSIVHSPTLNELATALAKAQAEIEGAKKDSTNPHFRSKYADLASVWDAIREPLSKNGLAVTQMPAANGDTVSVTTMLIHTSGQFIGSSLSMKITDKITPQSIGSAITYARRYALSAVVGVAPEDDDGNAATGSPANSSATRIPAAAWAKPKTK